MKFKIFLLSLLSLGGCKSVTNTVVPCPDEVDSAVLDKMFPEFNRTPNYLDVWLSHNYDPASWNPRFDAHQRRLDEVKQWAEGLSDNCTRTAYLHWIAFYQGELDSAREELRTKETKIRQEEYNQNIKLDNEKTKEYQRTHAVPTPPRKQP